MKRMLKSVPLLQLNIFFDTAMNAASQKLGIVRQRYFGIHFKHVFLEPDIGPKNR